MRDRLITALDGLGKILKAYVHGNETLWTAFLDQKISHAEAKNKWFTKENIMYSFTVWSELLTAEKIKAFVSPYPELSESKTLGLILAGNIPMVGLHDVLCAVLSGLKVDVKLSSKDDVLIPALMEIAETLLGDKFPVVFTERLQNYDLVIATGGDTTGTYFEYYFRNVPHIIRKSRSSVAVLSGEESDEQLEKLGEDIFRYFGLGCRNVSYLFIPENMPLDKIFKNLLSWGEIIHHHSYANNYDYHKAIYLMNQDQFFDNNFVMMKESEQLSSPLSVIHFKRYQEPSEVLEKLTAQASKIQCIVSDCYWVPKKIAFGSSQKPGWDEYPDDINTMEFFQKHV